MRDREQLQVGRAAREAIRIRKNCPSGCIPARRAARMMSASLRLTFSLFDGVARDEGIAHVRERRAFDEGDAVEQNLPGAEQRQQASRRQSGLQLVLPCFQRAVTARETRPDDPDLRLIQQTACVQGRRNASRAGAARHFECRLLLQPGDRCLQPVVAPPDEHARLPAPRTSSSTRTCSKRRIRNPAPVAVDRRRGCRSSAMLRAR
jgi:hypothetical protein